MKIACVGDNCIDYYDETGQAFPGGNPVNVSVYARRLGAETAYLGAVGTDRYADLLLDRLAELKIDISHVQKLQGSTALCHVTHENGDRVLGEYNEGVMSQFALRTIDLEFLRKFDLVVTGLWGHTEGNLADLQKMGILTAFDGADRPFDPAAKVALANSDIVFFSDDESTTLQLREKILAVKEYGPKTVIATRGAKGSMGLDGENFFISAPTPCKVVDTMGAGDSFIAGFLVARLQHRSMQDCMQAGADNAAVTIAYKGAW